MISEAEKVSKEPGPVQCQASGCCGEWICVGRKRVLRLMRQAGLLAPQRARGRRAPRPHDGTIIPDAPDRL